MAENEDDFVPDIPGVTFLSESDHDYTEGETPFDSSADDEVINVGFRTDMSPEDIDKETFRPIPEGDHIVEVLEIERLPVKTEKWYLKLENGEVVPRSIDVRKWRIKFCLIGDPNCTVTDNFVLPPDDKLAYEAYCWGHGDREKAIKKTRKEGGFWAKKARAFLAAEGFCFDKDGNPPPEAAVGRNWRLYPGTDVKRLIKVTVENSKPRDYPKKDPKTGETELDDTGRPVMIKGKPWPQVKMGSYRFVDPPEGVKLSASVKAEPASPAPSGKVNKKGRSV